MPNNKSVRKNRLRRMSNRARSLSKRVRNINRRLRRNSKRHNRNKRRSKGSRRRSYRRVNRRNMRGGVIEYSPLPCHADGSTHWDSTAQVGHETCVEYGTHGAENDKRFSGDQSLSKMKITDTIKDVVDQQLKDIMGNLDGQSAAAVRQAMQDRATALGGAQGRTDAVQGAMDPELSRQAHQVAMERQAAQAAADAATEAA